MYTFNDIQTAYDVLKEKRRNRLNEEIELATARVREELSEAEREFAKMLHAAYDAGMTKTELRAATRQYQSPRFKQLWDRAEYVGDTRTFMKDFGWSRTGATFTFYEGGWDWSGIESEKLVAKAHYSDTAGKYVLDLKKDKELAQFNMRNMRAISELLNKEMSDD